MGRGEEEGDCASLLIRKSAHTPAAGPSDRLHRAHSPRRGGVIGTRSRQGRQPAEPADCLGWLELPQDGCKMASGRPKMVPGGPKIGPIWAQCCPRWLQGGFKMAQIAEQFL